MDKIERALQKELDKRNARKSMAAFSRYICPDEPPALHHILLCDAIDEVINGDLRRLMVFMPPGSAKSTYSSIRCPAYYLGRFSDRSIICGSYGEGLSTSFGRKVRNIVDSRDYKILFKTKLAEDQRSKGEWSTKEDGSYFACGVGSGITGRRADLGLIDDPVKGRKDADSELVRNETWEWYRADFVSRLKPNASQIIIQCMTGDTPVLMADGAEKNLCDIRTGDKVATYDDGKIAESTVRNWKSQGLDSVFRIRTSSGIIVRANERHPFLVEREGKLEWIRLQYLNVGESVLTVTGESIEGLSASKKVATSQQSVKSGVCRITTRKSGLTDIVHHLLSMVLPRASAQSSNIVTASPLTTTRICSANKAEDAPFVNGIQQSQGILSIGTICSALTTAMKPLRLEGFFATIATWLSDEGKHQRFLNQQRHISDFILDKVEAIDYDGVEEVFDVQIDGTENFIANGLVSHNTRWHEDDLSGRILPEDWNGESGDFEGFDGQIWKVICIPAQARENDALGREVGEWLWTEWFHEDFWLETKKVQTSTDFRNWNSLYQQTPQPDTGTFFKREWFEPHRFKLGDEPAIYKYGASDYAVSDGKGDSTEHGIGGFDKNKDLWFVDWWSGQTTPDVWIEQQMNLRKKHSPFCWCAEVGVIRRSVEPYLKAAIRKSGSGLRLEWMPHIGDKAANARAFQALASQGRVHIPRTEWGDDLLNQLVKFIPNTNFKDDKVDVCGLFGRILDSSFAPTDVIPEEEEEYDSYGFDEEPELGWKTA